VRLARDDQYAILRTAYALVRRWKRKGVAQEVEYELRIEAQVAISPSSSLFLVLLRSALPSLDMKRASKWASALMFADHQNIRSKRLVGFLRANGGIEGAARQSANLRKA